MDSNATFGNACLLPMKATSNGVFQGDNPLDFALPLAILQICTNVGKTTLSAITINDIAAWVLLALAIALSGHDRSPLMSLWVFFVGGDFDICAILIVPPIFKWMSHRCHEGELVEEVYIYATLVVVLAVGFVSLLYDVGHNPTLSTFTCRKS